MKKVHLVTGGCGFVGKHLINRLLEKTDDCIVVVDDLCIGHVPDSWSLEKSNKHLHPISERMIFIYEDIRRYFRKEEYYNKEISKFFTSWDGRYNDVYHFAAVVGGRSMIEENPLYVAVDLSIDAEFFHWASSHRPDRILYPSSSAAYPIELQSKENHKQLEESDINFNQISSPDLTYGWAKVTGEMLARLCHKKTGIHIACIRPFSGYGPGQSLDYPVPSILARIKNNESPIEVWGDGNQSRDFVYIDDVIDAMTHILDNVRDGGALNIASGKATSFNQLITTGMKIVGINSDIKPLTHKPVGVHKRYGSPELCRVVTGWESRISLEEGLTRVLDFMAQSAIKT